MEVAAVLIGALVALLLQQDGWNRGWRKDQIRDLPEDPGVYVLYYSKKAYVGSTNNLKRRLREHRKRRWETFDWKRTGSDKDARREEQELREKLRKEGRSQEKIHRPRRKEVRL